MKFNNSYSVVFISMHHAWIEVSNAGTLTAFLEEVVTLRYKRSKSLQDNSKVKYLGFLDLAFSLPA